MFAVRTFAAALLLVLPFGATGMAQDSVATLRGDAPLVEQPTAPAMQKVSNEDLRRTRNYPEQPPTIPHHIRDYRINLNTNKCLTCHSRKATADSQAPMVSITHFMDRDGQFLATVSPRRYFCTQCHVPQLQAPPLVENTFVDIDTLIEGRSSGSKD
jgi:nitrate reductase cytochrome c-type subunit